MTPRRRWRAQPEAVRFCSAACRGRGVTEADRALEAAIIALLGARSQGSTICPSEAVRALDPGVTGEALRAQMEPARRAARRLVNTGRLEFLQRGRVVDPSTARGPVRLRLRRQRPDET
jgi:hypothetical protein